MAPRKPGDRRWPVTCSRPAIMTRGIFIARFSWFFSSCIATLVACGGAVTGVGDDPNGAHSGGTSGSTGKRDPANDGERGIGIDSGTGDATKRTSKIPVDHRAIA